MSNQRIRVHFVDFGDVQSSSFCIGITDLLNEYDVIFDSKKPDFLFFSCFGMEHRRYDCVKIMYTGENITPDFNWCDYAIGFDYLEFEDRYFRYPLYRFVELPDPIPQRERSFYVAEAESKKEFCNFLYSNSRFADPIRVEFFERLSKYKRVDSGGKVRNNTGYFVKDKIAWQRQYKFSIAFENSAKNGYTTEKILEPLMAHTIPIYWGDPRICEEFNVKRFINYADYQSMDAVIERVRELDNDQQQYLETLSQPWFVAPHHTKNDLGLITFLRNILDQGPIAARRIPAYGFTQSMKVREMQKTFLGKMRNSLRKRKKVIKSFFSCK